MHPLFENSCELGSLYYANVFLKIETEKECISFLQDLELIPLKHAAPPCPVCGGFMVAVDQEIAWLWKCSADTCNGIVNPLQNTFFEEIPIPLLDTVAFILNFVDKREVFDAWEHVYFWTLSRNRRNKRNLSEETVKQIYAKCRRVCEIIMSQEHERMIGPYSSTLYLMYLKRTLNPPFVSRARKASTFLMDVKAVYPGYGKIGLNYKHLSSSLSATAGI